ALRGDVRELVDVRARGEEERLPRHDRGREVTALELLDHGFERTHRRLAEERGLRVVRAVVDRDESDVARTGEAELSDRHRSASSGEPPGSPEPPPPVR